MNAISIQRIKKFSFLIGIFSILILSACENNENKTITLSGSTIAVQEWVSFSNIGSVSISMTTDLPPPNDAFILLPDNIRSIDVEPGQSINWTATMEDGPLKVWIARCGGRIFNPSGRQ